MEFAKITLKKGKEASPLRKHHWIFSGAIARQDEHLKDGDPVEVFDFQKNKIATGYFNQGSIAVKILAFGNETVDEKFFLEKFKTALAIREKAGLLNNPQTNAYRLIHAEGDGLPGLVIDYYNGHVVVQIHHVYMMSQVELISKVLRQLLPDIQTIYLKFTTKFRSEIDPYIFGNTPQTIIKENGISFEVNWEKGQKTGFFLDQRDNRFLLSKYAPQRNMLNTFCYTGGFSIYALANQVNSVTSVDSSAHAMEGLEKNIALNSLSNQTHHSLTQDALEYLTKTEEAFDLIILDPPAFAKSMSARHNAIMAYKRINALALKKITEGGILFTYSCSQVVDRSAFVGAVLSAAIETKREVKILHQLSQPADHPVNIFHPETEYLKGLVLFVK
jgi:23S rRNA (cytosine1962-C5)-methyltransferase